MPYNPMAAPNPEPRKFKNTVRGIVNEIMTFQEAADRKLLFSGVPEKEDPQAPYWCVQFIADDSRGDDGSDTILSASSKLFVLKTPNNPEDGYKPQDNRQRPAQVSRAFAGLGISIFPGDPTGKFNAWCGANVRVPGYEDGIGTNPDYDASRFVGNHFIVEKPAPDRNNPNDPAKYAAPLPIAELGTNFVYTGEVRILSRNQNQANPDGSIAPSQINFQDIMTDESARSTVVSAILGKKVADLGDVLLAAGVSHNCQVNGESVVAAAMSGTLAITLQAAGFISVSEDGTVGTPVGATA